MTFSNPVLFEPCIERRAPEFAAAQEEGVAIGLDGWGGEEFCAAGLACGGGCVNVGFVPLLGGIGAPIEIVF